MSNADAPVCRSGQRVIYSGARQEVVKVLCELDANPKNVSFAWKFNSSATEFLDLPVAHIFPDKSNAVVIYTPMTEHVSSLESVPTKAFFSITLNSNNTNCKI